MIGLKNSRHILNQSEVKQKPIVACRASFHADNGLLYLFGIGQSNNFGFGFTTLNWKLL